MSMNVRFGTETCHCYIIRQTTTEDTKKILESPDPMQAYFEWLQGRFEYWATNEIEDLKRRKTNQKKLWKAIQYARRSSREKYENETQTIAAYAAAHPTAEWTMT